jgi:hypothetical protein
VDTKTQLTQLLGEYSDIPHLLPSTERGFLDNPPQPLFNWLINLIEIIKDIINKPCNIPTPPEFSFKLNGKAALQNLAILSKYGFDLNKLQNQTRTHRLALGKNSEFQTSSAKFSVYIPYGQE